MPCLASELDFPLPVSGFLYEDQPFMHSVPPSHFDRLHSHSFGRVVPFRHRYQDLDYGVHCMSFLEIIAEVKARGCFDLPR